MCAIFAERLTFKARFGPWLAGKSSIGSGPARSLSRLASLQKNSRYAFWKTFPPAGPHLEPPGFVRQAPTREIGSLVQKSARLGSVEDFPAGSPPPENARFRASDVEPRIWGLWFMVHGSGVRECHLRVSSEFGVHGSWFMVHGSWFRVQDLNPKKIHQGSGLVPRSHPHGSNPPGLVT